jgi:putative chitobiose transport system substrate-binding protein
VSTKRFSPVISLLIILTFILAACGGGTPATPDTASEGSAAPAAESAAPSVEASAEESAEASVEASVEASADASAAGGTVPTGPGSAALIPNVEEGAEITFWTYFLSPTFDEYIRDTIARFNEVYPGVTVNWEDRQATLQDEYRNSLAAGNAPDVVNLSTRWVPEFAQNDQLINMSEALPPEAQEQYFPSLFEQVQVDGQSYQVPWYQALSIYAINTELIEQASLTVEDMPTNYEELRQVCQTLVDQANTQCGLRLNADNILSDMAYQGGVQVMNEDGTEFTFNSPEGVEWLQYWADMVKNNLTARDLILAAEDRPGLERFSAGQLPFYATGPQLIRIIKENNPNLYPKLAISPVPVGESGAIPPSSMSIAVSKQTEYPNASLALATFFTNPDSMTEFAKLVPVFPSTPESYEDPFFSEPGELIEDQPRALAQETIGQQADILPEIPQAREVNEIVRQAVEQALFSDVTPEQALEEAAAEANALIQ